MVCRGSVGSHEYFEIRTLPPVATAPAPLSLNACSVVSMQRLAWPAWPAPTLASAGHVRRRSSEAIGTAPPGPRATEGWKRSVVAASFSCIGDEQHARACVDGLHY